MENQIRILAVDDEIENRQFFSDILSTKFNVTCASDGMEAIRLAREIQPDIVLLDIHMPKIDGLTTCDLLRSHHTTRHIPIIMVSGYDTEDYRTYAFQNGADDFLAKPFTLRELTARINSKIRRKTEQNSVPERTLACGTIELQLDRYEVTAGGERLNLSVLEFNLLRYFVQNKERVLSRERILRDVWSDAVVADRTVDAHVSLLRKKLAKADYSIRTIYGAGYILEPARAGRESEAEKKTQPDSQLAATP